MIRLTPWSAVVGRLSACGLAAVLILGATFPLVRAQLGPCAPPPAGFTCEDCPEHIYGYTCNAQVPPGFSYGYCANMAGNCIGQSVSCGGTLYECTIFGLVPVDSSPANRCSGSWSACV